MNMGEYRVGWEGVKKGRRKAGEERVGGDWI